MQTLLASAARTADGNSGVLAVTHLDRIRTATFFLDVTAAATDTGDTLDVYVQASPDGGTTWDDFIHFTQVLGDGGAKEELARWFRDTVPGDSLQAPDDAAMGVGVRQGPVGTTWRIKWVIVDVSGDDASFTFSVTVNAGH